ncbi:MAG TPA: hypothetical protein PK264_22925 [Hyphomicrobiaceae bacterium]|nr:hypothetical protein [Hyphomicrobiaceae bacterium]
MPVVEMQPTETLLPPSRFYFWRGASGQSYVHTIHSLIDCPAITQACYVLVRRLGDGSMSVRAVGRTTGQSETLNLAHIRHLAASLGANEVHLHLMADGESRRARVEFDLRASLFAMLGDAAVARH